MEVKSYKDDTPTNGHIREAVPASTSAAEEIAVEIEEENSDIPECVDEFLRLLALWTIEEYHLKGKALPEAPEDKSLNNEDVNNSDIEEIV